MADVRDRGWRRVLLALVIGAAVSVAVPTASAEVATAAGRTGADEAGLLTVTQMDAGDDHTCAVLSDGSVRCWGSNTANGIAGPRIIGKLGYPGVTRVGDDESPGPMGPVDLGPGRTAIEVAVGGFHTCAILDTGSVRCWGSNAGFALGYPSLDDAGNDNVGDDESPASVGTVDLGAGRTAVHITAGTFHTCALLDNHKVRCWGTALDSATVGEPGGVLGLGNNETVGDDETPGSVPTVDLGIGRTAVQVEAGSHHTCALLDNGAVRCWGDAGYGALGLNLGFGTSEEIGDDETPGSQPVVNLGSGRTAMQLATGEDTTCAVLDNGRLRCWGYGSDGRLGQGDGLGGLDSWIGDDETPASAPPIDLGLGRTALSVTTGNGHTCAILDNRRVRCWGTDDSGQVGLALTPVVVGRDEVPGAVDPVDLGAGRTVLAITAGKYHTCASLDDGHVRCWGYGLMGRLGYGNTDNVGDDEVPGAVTPVDLSTPRTERRPDALIHKGAGATIGDGVYNTTGAGQTIVTSAVRGRTLSFTITVANDGNTPDTYTLRGSASTSQYAITYFSGATDITSAVTGGSSTPSLNPGASFTFTMKVKVRNSAAAGSSVTPAVKVTSVGDTTRKDVVKARVARA